MITKKGNQTNDNKLRRVFDFNPRPMGEDEQSSKKQCVLCRVFKKVRKGK